MNLVHRSLQPPYSRSYIILERLDDKRYVIDVKSTPTIVSIKPAHLDSDSLATPEISRQPGLQQFLEQHQPQPEQGSPPPTTSPPVIPAPKRVSFQLPPGIRTNRGVDVATQPCPSVSRQKQRLIPRLELSTNSAVGNLSFFRT